MCHCSRLQHNPKIEVRLWERWGCEEARTVVLRPHLPAYGLSEMSHLSPQHSNPFRGLQPPGVGEASQQKRQQGTGDQPASGQWEGWGRG